MSIPLDKKDTRQLDDDEIRMVRDLMEEWRRYKWFLSFLSRLAAWVGGVITTVWIGRDLIAKIFKAVAS